MNRTYDIRKYGLLIIVLAVLFYVSSLKMFSVSCESWDRYFFLSRLIPIGRLTGSMSVLLGTLAVTALSFMSFYHYRFYSANETFLLMFFSALLILSLPVAISIEPVHVAAILFMSMLIIQDGLGDKGKSEETVFMMMTLFSVSSFFFSPMLWLTAPVTIACLHGRDAKPRIMLNVIAGMLTPFIIMVGAMAVFSDYSMILGAFEELWHEMIDVDPRIIPVRTATVLKNIALTLMLAIAMIRLLASTDKTSAWKAVYLHNTVLYAIAMSVLALLYCNHQTNIWILPISLCSVLLFSYLSDNSTRKTSYGCILILMVIVIERAVWLQ